jgi:hypothetical protein
MRRHHRQELERRRAEVERRHDDLEPADDGSPRRRREDVLEELVRELRRLRSHGSENFRRYRRRAMLAFAVLVAAAVLEGIVIVHNANMARADLARSGVIVALRACASENDLRAAMRGFVVAVAGPHLGQAAAAAFPERDCLAQATPLRNRLRSP